MSALDDVLRSAAVFAGGVLGVTPLEGGLTNVNHRVDTDAGAYVVRVWSQDDSPLGIDRDHEYSSSVRAAAVGVGAPVVDYLPRLRAMIFGFVPGRTMTAEDLRRGDHLGLVAATCRRLHGAERFDADFDMFAVQARYLALVRDQGFRLPDGYEALGAHLPAIRDALAVRAPPSVPCHNDLLAENLILAGDRLTLIDYEYAGNNDPCFELGNLWSESGLTATQLEELVTAYFGRPLRHQVARARLWGLMSQYGWTLWASIQDAGSTLDFDFWAWGLQKYERAVATFASGELDGLLAEARRAD